MLIYTKLIAIFLMLQPIQGFAHSQASNGEDMGITILGSITNNRMQDNVALVKELSTGSIKAVKINHTVLKDYVVTAVFAKYIALRRGTEEFLVYQNKFAGDFVAQSSTAKAVLAGAAPPPSTFSEPGFERRDERIRMTSSYRDKLIKDDLSKVLMQATAIPYIDNGTFIGFRILQIDAGSIFDKAGLRDHDVVTAINGQRLDSAGTAISLLQSLRSAESIEVEFSRGQTAKKMNISVD